MAAQENVTEIGSKRKLFRYVLKDSDGKVAAVYDFVEPLPLAYLIWRKRLFVTSRDEPGVLLERSYHVLMEDDKVAGDERH